MSIIKVEALEVRVHGVVFVLVSSSNNFVMEVLRKSSLKIARSGGVFGGAEVVSKDSVLANSLEKESGIFNVFGILDLNIEYENVVGGLRLAQERGFEIADELIGIHKHVLIKSMDFVTASDEDRGSKGVADESCDEGYRNE